MAETPSKSKDLAQKIETGNNFLTSARPEKEWLDTPVEFKPGNFNYPAKASVLEAIQFPNPRKWSPEDQDWQLPENWKETILTGMQEKLNNNRAFKVFMDICVRCGACADKCHFYLGTGDPKNMPVVRAELMRSVYRGEFTLAGKALGPLVGARKLTKE
ncbi:MAG: (Fe-S)-binding protein, partial [Deltaproteobacteria bacterium]|nr:(Fe-S)-binding protein [Deltaproteobacteria bacterium]